MCNAISIILLFTPKVTLLFSFPYVSGRVSLADIFFLACPSLFYVMSLFSWLSPANSTTDSICRTQCWSWPFSKQSFALSVVWWRYRPDASATPRCSYCSIRIPFPLAKSSNAVQRGQVCWHFRQRLCLLFFTFWWQSPPRSGILFPTALSVFWSICALCLCFDLCALSFFPLRHGFRITEEQ